MADGKKIQSLDDKFWVWETLEEEIRPVADELSHEEVEAVSLGFATNLKGSTELMDILMDRIMAHQVTTPMQSGVNPFH